MEGSKAVGGSAVGLRLALRHSRRLAVVHRRDDSVIVGIAALLGAALGLALAVFTKTIGLDDTQNEREDLGERFRRDVVAPDLRSSLIHTLIAIGFFALAGYLFVRYDDPAVVFFGGGGTLLVGEKQLFRSWGRIGRRLATFLLPGVAALLVGYLAFQGEDPRHSLWFFPILLILWSNVRKLREVESRLESAQVSTR